MPATDHPPALGWPRRAFDRVRLEGWLSPARSRGYGRLVAACSLLLCAGLAGAYGVTILRDPHALPLLTDFNAYWSAGRLAALGHPALAYDGGAIRAMELTTAQDRGHGGYFPFLYPPVFLLVCAGFALLPFLAALPAFILAGWALFAATMRAILPRTWPILAILGFPGAAINLVSTQNGFLSAACFGGAMLQLDRRPELGGALLGLLVFKPQLGVCIPVALVAARRWRALAACAASAGSLVLLSWLVFGSPAWLAFIGSVPATQRASQLPGFWSTGVSVDAAALILGAPHALAYALQALAALCAMGWLAIIAARRPGAGPEVAALVCAAMFCTPYMMDYDLVCLAVPLAWLAREAAGGWRPWERATIGIAYPYPLAARALTLQAGLPVTPLVVAALFAVVGARALATRPSPAGTKR